MNTLERQIKELQEENKRLEERYVRRKEIYVKLLKEREYKIDKAIGLIHDYQMNDRNNANYKELLYCLESGRK